MTDRVQTTYNAIEEAQMTGFEAPRKRYTTEIILSLPSYHIFVDSWEEAEEVAEKLLKDCIREEDRGTTTVTISPLRRTQYFYRERRLQRRGEGSMVEDK